MRSNYLRPAIKTCLVLVGVFILLGAILALAGCSATPVPAPTQTEEVSFEWDPEGCDAEDKAKGEWDECWLEFLTSKGKSPTPRPTGPPRRIVVPAPVSTAGKPTPGKPVAPPAPVAPKPVPKTTKR